MQIGELAKQTGCSIQTIRFYERKGLLDKPSRTEGNYRLYNKAAADKLTFIKQCRALDISMKEIELLLAQKAEPKQSCASVNQLIDKHIESVDEKIYELSQLKNILQSMSAKCSDNKTIKDCGILNALER
ncbi:Cd(II)/Pb(II)-responsive transcriptional regulator [Aestuariibacter sp. AA17]|uniref:Cd(II)/Pb(II)-responsive transcriptional regulator n=1 Tax=Fluctibacter corallii TaxID=2984329 RepID=A0ABT3A688_9ALTE|nr:Cd(II)/Pb(II)-responsive transcriptional regulator [Aestuariibacter sp. AA17]MCV2884181.1 Cd(II)/Pb(II)-responsive transcriptional regulator [Aestuariibacter sp. AA17]